MTSTVDNLKIGLVLAIVGIGGGAAWLSALYTDVQGLKAQVAEVRSDVKEILKTTGDRRHADNKSPEGSDS